MNEELHHDHKPEIIARNMRVGLILFVVYVLLYGGFIFINVFKYEWMSHRPFGGLNLAIIYGYGLIAAALVLALIYTALCRKKD